ncbi:AP2-associated kinase [Strigomonas culicis]|nr:AP2-associated kinase [Strigomonas culicis]|eukprot:EPY27649.1 AP2-associated kinase [Strigomonas culicis]
MSPSASVVTYYDSEVITRRNTSEPEIWITMEYCEGPSLQDYINTRIQLSESFSVKEVYEIIDNVVQAIGHLHSQSPPISHWDIKPDNFLFTHGGILKLCDFGSASRIYYEPKREAHISAAQDELNSKMTLLYRAPESLDLWSKQRIDTKADIWSLGVLIYVLVFCEMPFEANTVEIIDGVPRRFRSEINSCPEPFAPLMAVVMKTMLVKDPQKRADIFTVSEALSQITKLDSLTRPSEGLETQRPRF